MAVEAADVKKLREMTGAGVLECKQALEETCGDFGKATDILKKKGFAKAAKKLTRSTNEGRIGAYIHSNGKIGTLVEINCETDFVARNELVQQLLKDLCMQVAATNPISISREDIPEETLERQKEVFKQSVGNKPANIAEKIISGKMEEFFKEKCLLEQPFIKDNSQSVRDLITGKIANLGENIKVNRFVRFEIGE
ncbi:MAG TPA: translation elongation factor Ts [Candidatus Brocadiia bacterium]|nr:translation elongation factor Ts [Planctomycetota bacterium]MDO8093202.1 translation elongation factor Ts [Candidatus Brocadiales bacterium]